MEFPKIDKNVHCEWFNVINMGISPDECVIVRDPRATFGPDF